MARKKRDWQERAYAVVNVRRSATGNVLPVEPGKKPMVFRTDLVRTLDGQAAAAVAKNPHIRVVEIERRETPKAWVVPELPWRRGE